MKIGLFGQFGSGNLGNDGSLEAMLQLLRRVRPDADLPCICPRPDVVSRRFGIATAQLGGRPFSSGIIRAVDKVFLKLPHRLSGFIGAVTVAHGLDLVIVPGTGILDDFGEGPFGWPLVVLCWALATRLGGAKLAFVSIGAGPVANGMSRRFIRMAGLIAAFRSYRDTISQDFMKSLGVDSRADPVSADLAFALPPAEDEPRNHAQGCVGIGVMTYRGWKKRDARGPAIYEAYLGKLAEIAETLLRQGQQVRLLIGDLGDREAIDNLLNRIHAPGAEKIVVEPAASLEDVMRQIATTDIVVASRYHNIVCALAMGRPAISLGYAAKNGALLSDTGLDGFQHHIETFDPKAVLAQIDTMLERREQLAADVREGVKRYRLQLAHQEEILRAGLLREPRDAALSPSLRHREVPR